MIDLKDREVYNFHRTEKKQKVANRKTRSDIKSDTKNKKALRDTLDIGKPVLGERLKKGMFLFVLI